MNKLLKSYLSFTRTERMGIIGLCSLFILLLAIRVTMPLWVHKPPTPEKEKQLVAAWEKFKNNNTTSAEDVVAINSAKKDRKDTTGANEPPLPDIININTADSATLVRLNGIGPATAHKIIRWRRRNGPYTDIEDLKLTCSFSKEAFESLKKHLRTGNK